MSGGASHYILLLLCFFTGYDMHASDWSGVEISIMFNHTSSVLHTIEFCHVEKMENILGEVHNKLEYVLKSIYFLNCFFFLGDINFSNC